MITENEAKKKVCPYRAGYQENSVEKNHRTEGQYYQIPSVACIASECMAWRWNKSWVSSIENPAENTLTLKLKRSSDEPVLGYCGLAGKP